MKEFFKVIGNFLKDYILEPFSSIDERRMSSLIIVFCFFGYYTIQKFNEIGYVDGNMTTIILAFISVIGGINVINIGSEIVKNVISFKSGNNSNTITTTTSDNNNI